MTFSRVICGLTAVTVSLLAQPGATVAPPQAPAAASVTTVDGQRAFVQQVPAPGATTTASRAAASRGPSSTWPGPITTPSGPRT